LGGFFDGGRNYIIVILTKVRISQSVIPKQVRDDDLPIPSSDFQTGTPLAIPYL
jgi:hypothetical protein